MNKQENWMTKIQNTYLKGVLGGLKILKLKINIAYIV